jgi:hypothetical protein
MHRLYADMVIRFFRFKSCHAELDSASKESGFSPSREWKRLYFLYIIKHVNPAQAGIQYQILDSDFRQNDGD